MISRWHHTDVILRLISKWHNFDVILLKWCQNDIILKMISKLHHNDYNLQNDVIMTSLWYHFQSRWLGQLSVVHIHFIFFIIFLILQWSNLHKLRLSLTCCWALRLALRVRVLASLLLKCSFACSSEEHVFKIEDQKAPPAVTTLLPSKWSQKRLLLSLLSFPPPVQLCFIA